jgi:DNA helicase-2/ATP-dependent DNA helicase PcrA
MEKLYLTYATTRYRFGRLLDCEPSRFLSEISPDCIKVTKRAVSVSFQSEKNEEKSGFIGLKKPPLRTGSTAKLHVPSPDFKPSNTNNLATGMKIEHPKFGFGKVVKIEIEGLNKKATIQFENFGEKTLLLSFAKLRILD